MTDTIHSELEHYLRENGQAFPDTSKLKEILDCKFERITQVTKKNFFEFIHWYSYEYAPKKQLVTNNETSVTSINMGISLKVAV